jgi:WD40 repeat protein
MFDPYLAWLNIPADQRPPTLYQLLGLRPGESSPKAINEAAEQRAEHLRGFLMTEQYDLVKFVQAEVAQARRVLLDPIKKEAYDAELLAANKPTPLPPKRGIGLPIVVGLLIGVVVLGGLVVAGGVAAVVFLMKPIAEIEGPHQAEVKDSGSKAPPKSTLPQQLPKKDDEPPDKDKQPKGDDKKPDPEVPMPANLGDAPRTLKAERSLYAIAILAGGSRALVRSDALELWDLERGLQVRTLDAAKPGLFGPVTVTPDGRWAVSCSGGEALAHIYDLRIGIPLGDLKGHYREIRSLAITPDGKQILTGAGSTEGKPKSKTVIHEDTTVRLWETATQKLLHTFPGHTTPVTQVAFVPGTPLALSCSGDALIVWNLEERREVRRLPGATSGNRGLAVSSDGAFAVSGSDDGNVRLWDLKSFQQIADKAIHKGAVTTLAWSAKGNYIASGSADATVRVWDGRTMAEVAVLTGNEVTVSGVAFTPDDRHLVSVGMDKTLRIWPMAWVEQQRKK